MRIRGVGTNKKSQEPVFYPIEVSKLKLAPYQRNIQMNRVKRYADNYDPCIFGVILVNHRDNDYYIIDGQHRVEVAKMRHIESVLCQVLEGLSYEEECEKFLKLNSERKELNANQSFKARVERGDKNALKLVEILNKYGFTYNPDRGVRGDNMIGAIKTLEEIVKQNGYNMVERILSVCRNAWYGAASCFDVNILRGLNTFFAEYPQVNISYLIEILEKIAPENIKRKAIYNIDIDTVIGLEGGHGKKEHIARTIRDIYNDFVPRRERLV